MIYIKTQRSLSNASTRLFRAVSDRILSNDTASTVDVSYHHCDNDFCLKNLSNESVLMYIKTADKNHEDAPFEIQIMYASTVSIKLIHGSIRLYCHSHYILAEKYYRLV